MEHSDSSRLEQSNRSRLKRKRRHGTLRQRARLAAGVRVFDLSRAARLSARKISNFERRIGTLTPNEHFRYCAALAALAVIPKPQDATNSGPVPQKGQA